jgi:hypothetical protein
MNFNYFISDAVGQFLIDAVELLASAGHRLLEDYRFDPCSGLWRHRDVPERRRPSTICWTRTVRLR